jgi:hypothetical protein
LLGPDGGSVVEVVVVLSLVVEVVDVGLSVVVVVVPPSEGQVVQP